MKTRNTHDLQVKEMIKKFQVIKQNQKFPSSNLEKTVSNTLRNPRYRHFRKELGIDRLNAIIEIDNLKMEALVEPSCPMDKLATACSAFDLMVPVMPEFKGITVGGAINGAAIESSSHRFSQFNNICISYEVLLGNGELVEASKESYPDLFYGISGAYGSFGIITLVKLKLFPRKPLVLLTYHRFQDLSKGLKCLELFSKSQNPPEFIEGIIFDHHHIVIIEGYLKTKEESYSIKNMLSLTPLSPFFYQHVKETDLSEELISTDDYLFRHDRGAFWMGAYALNPKLLLRYYMENHFHLNKISKKLFGELDKTKYFKVKNPGILFRYFMGWWMNSRKLFKMLHTNSENWFKENFIIQDYYIPSENALDFLDLTIKETEVFPIWLCPVIGTVNPEIFSPHYQLQKRMKQQLFIDIGIYGMPNSSKSLESINRFLDQHAKDLQGRKMLYSYNFYSNDEFFDIYSKDDYRNLRQKYHAEEVWVDIFDKL